MKRKSNDDAFITISNQKIYDKIIEIQELNNSQHTSIINRLDNTNGKVKLSHWMATTALTFIIVLLGMFIQHITKTGG